jgi:hypothetical protein
MIFVSFLFFVPQRKYRISEISCRISDKTTEEILLWGVLPETNIELDQSGNQKTHEQTGKTNINQNAMCISHVLLLWG